MTALFDGERVSHTDTFILAGVALALFISIKTFRKRMQRLDQGSPFNAGGLFLSPQNQLARQNV